MIIKKMGFLRAVATILILSNLSSLSLLAKNDSLARSITITVPLLQNDLLVFKIYVTKKIADDLQKAKKWGKGMAKTFAGISSYTFDAIPFEFYTDLQAIDEVFKRLTNDAAAAYIQEAKEEYKKTLTGAKKKVSQNTLGAFLYKRVVARINVIPEQRVLLEKDPLKMDEFVRSGIVKKDEYMYYTLLNFAVRYYLEQESKRK
jgi:hypothetical protein